MNILLVIFAFLFIQLPDQDLSHKVIRDAYYKSYNYEKLQDYENAIKALNVVYTHYPNGYTVNLRMGWLYYLNKNYANALRHYQNAIKTAPASLEAKNGYLLPLLAQQKFDEVEQTAYQIIAIDHYNYYGNLRLAYALRMTNKLEQAEIINTKMLTAYPTDVSFLSELALVKIAQGDKEAADKLFKDIIILDPENVTAKSYIQDK